MTGAVNFDGHANFEKSRFPYFFTIWTAAAVRAGNNHHRDDHYYSLLYY
jgi:hypothetical protein